MAIIEFTVQGDPVGKIKLTRGQQWTPAAQNYAGYKKAIQAAIQPALVVAALDLRETDPMKLMKGERYLKPISSKAPKIRVDVFCHFRDEHHPDPSNVLETINDAIFVDDKHVMGFFDFDHEGKTGASVDVKITI